MRFKGLGSCEVFGTEPGTKQVTQEWSALLLVTSKVTTQTCCLGLPWQSRG